MRVLPVLAGTVAILFFTHKIADATVTCENNLASEGCPDGVNCWFNRGDDSAIHVYFSNDMAEDFRACTPTTVDDNISEVELRRYLWSAAALGIWRREASLSFMKEQFPTPTPPKPATTL